MEKVVQRYRSAKQADRADREFYRGLTPRQRLEMMFEIIWMRHAAGDEMRIHPDFASLSSG